MAKRRMFDINVIETDRFYRMKPLSQTLYFHLNLNADDDGFVEMWKSIMSFLHCKRLHLDELIREEYILVVNDDTLLITDWLLHNRIPKDRYSKSKFNHELASMLLHPNGRYFKEL